MRGKKGQQGNKEKRKRATNGINCRPQPRQTLMWLRTMWEKGKEKGEEEEEEEEYSRRPQGNSETTLLHLLFNQYYNILHLCYVKTHCGQKVTSILSRVIKYIKRNRVSREVPIRICWSHSESEPFDSEYLPIPSPVPKLL